MPEYYIIFYTGSRDAYFNTGTAEMVFELTDIKYEIDGTITGVCSISPDSLLDKVIWTNGTVDNGTGRWVNSTNHSDNFASHSRHVSGTRY